MEIYISEEDLLQNIQHDFQEQYPFLKLQFYKNPHQQGMASPEKERLSPLEPVEEVSMFHMAGTIDISAGRTIAEVEHDFFKKLSLCVQVFRKSGTIWLETTGTDSWTLQQQNDKGKEYSLLLSPDKPQELDLQDVS